MTWASVNVIDKQTTEQTNEQTNERSKQQTAKMNAELTGFMDIHKVNGINRILDYHLFIRCGDKVYMEVKGVGDIVISFDELQKNKFWKYYYDVSLMLLMLTNDKHSVVDAKNTNVQYPEPRFWSINTAYIEGCYTLKTKKVKNGSGSDGYTCYYKINPNDVENMEYALPQDLDAYTSAYMARFEVRSGMFEKKSVYYYTFIFDYCVRLMENELDELSAFVEDKKNLVKLLALNEIEGINCDVIMMIYDSLVSIGNISSVSGSSRSIKNKFANALNAPDALAQILDM